MIGFYKLFGNAMIPQYATEQSACFDLHAHLVDEHGVPRKITVVDSENAPQTAEAVNEILTIEPQYRVLIPTGLVASMDKDHSLRTHVRSSMALKRGLALPNGEGIIDSDYYHEVFLMVENRSRKPVTVAHGERICQGELIHVLRYPISEIHTKPSQSSDRVGGFGSTGV